MVCTEWIKNFDRNGGNLLLLLLKLDYIPIMTFNHVLTFYKDWPTNLKAKLILLRIGGSPLNWLRPSKFTRHLGWIFTIRGSKEKLEGMAWRKKVSFCWRAGWIICSLRKYWSNILFPSLKWTFLAQLYARWYDDVRYVRSVGERSHSTERGQRRMHDHDPSLFCGDARVECDVLSQEGSWSFSSVECNVIKAYKEKIVWDDEPINLSKLIFLTLVFSAG